MTPSARGLLPEPPPATGPPAEREGPPAGPAVAPRAHPRPRREPQILDHDDHQGDSEEFAVLLLPGWRHPRSRKLHIRRDCRAVQFHGADMTPVLIRLDDDNEVRRVFSDEARCRYCFPDGTTLAG